MTEPRRFALAFLACLLTLLFDSSTAQARREVFRGLVVGIADGDTIKVMRQGKPVTVRLNCIDCPEKRQDFGTAAKQFTASKCFNKRVKIVSTGKDRYQRCIGQVILPDEKSLNLELVKKGYAWWYRQYAPDAREYQLAEIRARDRHIGLWQSGTPTPPWQFRRASSKNVRIASR